MKKLTLGVLATSLLTLVGCSDDFEVPKGGAGAAGVGGLESGGTAGASGGVSGTEAGGAAGSGGSTGGTSNPGGTGGVGSGGTSGAATDGAGGVAPVLTKVHVLSYADQRSVPNADVVISAGNGDFLHRGKADASGNVDIEVPAGASVTALSRTDFVSNGKRLVYRVATTITDVPESSAIELPTYWADSQTYLTETRVPMNLKLDFTAGAANRDYVRYVAGCNVQSSTNDPSITEGVLPCSGLDLFDVWAFAIKGGEVVAWTSALDQPWTEAGSKTIQMNPSADYFDDYNAYYSPIPSNSTGVYFDVTSYRSPGGFRLSDDVRTPSTQEALHIRTPPGGFLRVVADLRVDLGPGAGIYGRREGHTIEKDIAWNPTQSVAPVVDFSEVDFAGTSRPRASWTLGSGGLGDAVWVGMSQTGTTVEEGALIWSIVAPAATQGTVVAPKLPTDLQQFMSFNATGVYLGVDHINSLEHDGYDAIVREGGYFAKNRDYSSRN